MKEILSYLSDPNKSGVYIESFSIDLSILSEFLKEIVAFDTSSSRTSSNFKLVDYEEKHANHYPVRVLSRYAVEDLKEGIDHLSIYEPPKGPLMGKLSYSRKLSVISTRELGYREMHAGSRGAYFPSVFLSPNIAVLKTCDAINLKHLIDYPKLTFDVCSVKENGCQLFEEFIKSVPIIGKEIATTPRRKKHSSPYCSEPYPAAVMLWTCSIARNVPEDILNYFESSIAYFEKKEWRISIILAAIAVESLLAEIYEECYHENAPSEPLGALKDRIEKKQKFPPNVRKDVETVNYGRISAVHRGSQQVGERETRNTLMGATRFTQWAFEKGPLLC
jgi:hypothetical protein